MHPVSFTAKDAAMPDATTRYPTLAALLATGALAACIHPALAAPQAPPTPADTVDVYGPGGPAPAMRAVAQAFTAETGLAVNVVAGPAPQWMDEAKSQADVVFSGSENMMSGFLATLDGVLDPASVEPLYVRPSAILVRKGNPEAISGVRDLAREGMRVMVVNGAGQVGLWEDVVGRTGDLDLIAGFRRNIVVSAANSGLALKAWKEQPDIDAWLIWNHWQNVIPDLADAVEVEPELRIWRPMDVALSFAGEDNPAARAFVDYLESDTAKAIFAQWGWTGR